MDSIKPTNNDGEPPDFPEELRNELVNVFKLLADKTRLYILFHLFQAGELNVTEVCNLLDGHSQPHVSHHLLSLKAAGILNARKQGRNNYYSVNCDNMCDVVTNFFQFVCDKETNELRFKDFLMKKMSTEDGEVEEDHQSDDGNSMTD